MVQMSFFFNAEKKRITNCWPLQKRFKMLVSDFIKISIFYKQNSVWWVSSIHIFLDEELAIYSCSASYRMRGLEKMEKPNLIKEIHKTQRKHSKEQSGEQKQIPIQNLMAMHLAQMNEDWVRKTKCYRSPNTKKCWNCSCS